MAESLDGASLSWDHPALLVASDAALIARLRLQQSWYRSVVLNTPAGRGGRAGERLVGSMLDSNAVAANRALNFFGDREIVAYVDARVAEHRRGGRGLIAEDRLYRNMLSSQPMAFSVAAKLRTAPDAAAIVAAITGLSVATVEWVEAEWGPSKAEHLGDNTAADMAFGGRLSTRESFIVGAESKYSEPLERQLASKPERYSAAIAASSWCGPEFEAHMATRGHNQLSRDLLLSASLESSGVADRALALVITMEQDSPTRAAIERVQSVMTFPDRLRWVSWQDVIAALKNSSLAEFGERFEQRYVPEEWR